MDSYDNNNNSYGGGGGGGFEQGGQGGVDVGADLAGVDGVADQGAHGRVERTAALQRPALGLGVAPHPQQQGHVGQLGHQHPDLRGDDHP